MQISATIAGQAVQASGALVLSDQQRTFAITVDDVEVAFEFMGNDNAPSIASRLDGDKRVVITLQDWNNPLGTSYVLDDIVTVGNSQVSIGIFVQTVGAVPKADRVINYSVISRTGAAA